MLQSVAKNLTAGTANTIFTVPDGYHAVVTMFFVANVGGSTASYTASVHKAGVTVPFQGNKSIGAGTYDVFGGNGLSITLHDTDHIVVTPAAGSTFTAFATMDLIRNEKPPLYIE